MPLQPRSTISLFSLPRTLTFGFVLATFWFSGIADATQSNEDARSNSQSVSPDIDTNWRYTKFGWQNASSWVNPSAFVPRQTIELLHPFVWAGIVLTSVIATMIWASSEWDFARLFSLDDDEAKDNQSAIDQT